MMVSDFFTLLKFALCLLLFPCVVSSSQAQETPLDGSNSWAFSLPRDSFGSDAQLDLRILNEHRSGETGFIRLSDDGNDFLTGDGKPIRFWMVGTDAHSFQPAQMDQHARWLAKLGVNMCRLHVTVCANQEGAGINDVNEELIDGVFRFVQSAKQNGIYLILSPYYAHFDAPKSWGLPGGRIDMEGILFLDEKLQTAYKTWTRELYTRVNPYTGLALKDDPTIAILQIHNEDSLFFWTAQRLPDHYRRILRDKFQVWLIEKYGSIETAIQSWGDDAQPLDPQDDFQSGKVACLRIYDLTLSGEPALDNRRNDTAQFLAEFQRDFYHQMGAYLRNELGCQQLLNATNWRTANDAKLKALERYTYHALDIDAENEYVGSDYQHMGKNANYRIDPGHFLVNESVLGKPFEMCTNFVQQSGHPFILTESAWKKPNRYQSEGPFLVAAYQSLTGLDGVAWFSCQTPRYETDPLKSFWRVGDQFSTHKWNHCYPAMMAGFPANALLYRKRYLSQAGPIVEMKRSKKDIFSRKPAAINDNEAYGDQRNLEDLTPAWEGKDGEVNRSAFLVGPVISTTTDKESELRVGDIERFFDPVEKKITSSTGELVWNYGRKICKMQSDKAIGITGFLKESGGEFEFSQALLKSKNEYATINLVSLDGLPIEDSSKVLVQIVTVNRLTGYKTKRARVTFGEGENQTKIEGEEIVRTGEPPFRIENTELEIQFRSSHFMKATVLDINGYARKELPIHQGRIKVPHDCIYMIVRP